MLKILKSIKNSLLILILFSSTALAVGKPSSKYDGAYTYSDYCRGSKNSNAYDGSQFIIRDGIVTNDKGGAGRWTIDEKKSKVDEKGNIYIKGTRKGNPTVVKGNLNNDEKKYSVYQFKKKVGGKSKYYGDKKYGNLKSKRKHSGDSEYTPCILNLKRIGDVPKKVVSKDDRKVTEITIVSKNTNDDITLVNNEGKNQKVRVELRNLESISNGLIIVVPSSTPNMDDELYYEKQVSKHGYATAIVYGAEPRYQKKFTGSYTSSMILYDAIATIDEISKQYGKLKEVILIGSSTGSLAIFKAGWQKYRATFSVMENISKVFMINAACPDTFDGELNNDIMIYAINGKDDDSTPGWVCKNLKTSKNYSNIVLLSYNGAHHFESENYGKTKFEAKGKHILPTCSINYKKNLHSVVKVRNSEKKRDAEEKGFNKEHMKWIYNNCLKEGNYQGYDKKGATDFWQDVRSIIKDKVQPAELIGFNN